MSLTNEAEVENSLMEDLDEYDVKVAKFRDFFPPTRHYTVDEINKKLLDAGFDSILVISVANSEASANVVGYQTHTTANAYGTPYGAYGNAQSTTTPVIAYNRNTQTRAKLIALKTNNIIWVSDADTSASGAYYMNKNVSIHNFVREYVNELARIGRIKEKNKQASATSNN